jgi:Sodium/hydrogen exchanger family
VLPMCPGRTLNEMARPARLELATLCLEGRRSIQLSYGRVDLCNYITELEAAVHLPFGYDFCCAQFCAHPALTLHSRQSWASLLLAIGAVFLGRALSVYLLVPLRAVWGGLRGALALALALSLATAFPYREQILNLTFGVVIFSIVVQGLTIKPFVRILKLANGDDAKVA